MSYAQHLIERIAADPENPRVDVLSNELLREFQLGHPLDALRELMNSGDDDLVAVAVWIASELGQKCRPLLVDTVHLLRSPAKKVRFWAVDVLYWALPEHGCSLAAAIALLDDPEAGVRWKVLDVLSRLSTEQIEAASRCTQRDVLSSVHQDGLRWLLSGDALIPDKIKILLASSEGASRKYGVVAAARLRERNEEALVYASTIDDHDIQNFASGILA